MTLEVCGLCELLVASIEGANVGPVARVYPNVRAQVKIETKPLPAALERALEGLLARVDELVALELARLDERLPALGADVDAGPVRVQVLPHRRVVPEHLAAAFVRARDGAVEGRFAPLATARPAAHSAADAPRHFVPRPRKLRQLLRVRQIQPWDALRWDLLPVHILRVVRVRLRV